MQETINHRNVPISFLLLAKGLCLVSEKLPYQQSMIGSSEENLYQYWRHFTSHLALNRTLRLLAQSRKTSLPYATLLQLR
jgi:hypothetical protein